MNTRNVLLGLGLSTCFLAAAAGQAPFTAGNLVVLQVGTDGGLDPLAAVAAPGYLKEFTTAGTAVQTINLPAVAALSGNRAVNTRGNSTSEGFLSRSVDGQYLTFAGVNVDVGLSPTTAGLGRVIGRANAAGVVDTTTELTDGSYSGDSIRSAVSTNGTDIWIGGTSSTSANGGVRYTTFGSSSSIAVNIIEPRNMRVVKIFNNQLYVSTMSSTYRGVNTVGTGLPTAAGNSLVLLPGFDPGSAAPQDAYDYFFLNATTLYVADNRSTANSGGIQKWTDPGTGIWAMDYVINTGITTGVRGMTAVVNAGVPTFYCTTATANASAGNSIVTVTDTGAASAFTVIASSQANTWFKGIDFAPTGGGPVPCYANCDQTGGLTANDFICFLTAFNQGQSYADCDLVGGLTANDFICFVSAYNAGCS
jgi:hypothetical protein